MLRLLLVTFLCVVRFISLIYFLWCWWCHNRSFSVYPKSLHFSFPLSILSSHCKCSFTILNEECDSLLSSFAIVFDVVRFISSISFQWYWRCYNKNTLPSFSSHSNTTCNSIKWKTTLLAPTKSTVFYLKKMHMTIFLFFTKKGFMNFLWTIRWERSSFFRSNSLLPLSQFESEIFSRKYY